MGNQIIKLEQREKGLSLGKPTAAPQRRKSSTSSTGGTKKDDPMGLLMVGT